jgi:putative hydrolase of the HAD superfamily
VTRRIDRFDVVAFDADDTLWRSEDTFRHAEQRFIELVGPYAADDVDVEGVLHEVERADISVTGYGVKAFTLSMVRAAVAATDGRVPSVVVGELAELGRAMLLDEVHLLPHVVSVLEVVSSSVRTVLITKGDLVHQTRKVETSGIDDHFTDIEIVLEKDPDTYANVLRRLGVVPHRFLMIGNSVRSDVLPVLAIGGHAIHVPYHITWEHERVDDHGQDLIELASIADVPIWLGLAEM